MGDWSIPHYRNIGCQCGRTMDVLEQGFFFFSENNNSHAGIHPTASHSACS